MGILIDISSELSNVFDRENGYYDNREQLKERIRMPMNYNHEKQRLAYYMLDEVDSRDDILEMEDMLPMWIALATGYYLSLAVFGVGRAFGINTINEIL